jgi:hypothetical protein
MLNSLTQPIRDVIQTVRGQKVILDYELAAIYGTTTKRLNEQVRRNVDRFPEDFMFQLTSAEWAILVRRTNRSQLATGSQRHRDPRFMHYAFTEHGAIMAATVLNSPKKLTARLDMHEHVISDIIQQIMLLLNPPPEPEPPPKKIGFHEEFLLVALGHARQSKLVVECLCLCDLVLDETQEKPLVNLLDGGLIGRGGSVRNQLESSRRGLAEDRRVVPQNGVNRPARILACRLPALKLEDLE